MAKAKVIRSKKLPTVNLMGAQPVPTTNTLPQTAIGEALLRRAQGAMPTINAVPGQGFTGTNTIVPTPVPRADTIAQQVDAMEMQNAAAGVSLGDTTATQNGKTRVAKAKVKRK